MLIFLFSMEEIIIDALRIYLKEIKRHPRLSMEETVSLVHKMKQGGQFGALAKDKLIVSNLYLVIHVAKKFRLKYLPFLDLVQEGNIALMQAVERYKPGILPFERYILLYVKWKMIRFIQLHSYPVHIPIHRFEKKDINLPRRISIAAEDEKEDKRFLVDDEPSPYELAEHNILTEKINSFLDDLKPLYKEIIYQRFHEEKTFKSIGNDRGCSKENISQLELRAIEELRKNEELKQIAREYK